MVHTGVTGGFASGLLLCLILSLVLPACSGQEAIVTTPGTPIPAAAASLPPLWTSTVPPGTLAPTTPTFTRPVPTPTPSRFHVASAAEARLAFETSSARTLNQLMGLNRTLTLSEPEPLLFASGWCAASQEILEENYKVIETRLVVSGFEIDPSYYATRDFNGTADPANPTYCRSSYVLIDSWPGGMTYLEVRHKILEPLSDGWDEYALGVIQTPIIVYIGPE